MRFRNLKGLTSLPVESIKHRFRNEHVLTVLPVRGGSVERDSVLVATPPKLIILTADARPRARAQWMTQLAPWDVVRFSEDEISNAEDGEIYRLVIRVGSLTFYAALRGIRGQRALRDFVVVAQAQHQALAVS